MCDQAGRHRGSERTDGAANDEVHRTSAAAVQSLSSRSTAAPARRWPPRSNAAPTPRRARWSRTPGRRGKGTRPRPRDALPDLAVQHRLGLRGRVRPVLHRRHVGPGGGRFSPFSLTFSRNDGEQDLSGVSVTMPPGLSGKLAGVQQCSTAQIEAAQHNSGAAEQASPSCPAASQLGTVQAGAGPGERPFYDSGKVYLTGPYKGAPFGLVEIVPLLAGPFDLGTVVVRQTINIDPNTAQVSVSSVRSRRSSRVSPSVCARCMWKSTAPNSCSTRPAANRRRSPLRSPPRKEQARTYPAASRPGAARRLPFAPKLTATVAGHASKLDGASLDVKIQSGGLGQANIHAVELRLPKRFPRG